MSCKSKTIREGNLCIGHSNIQGGFTSFHKSTQVKNFISDEQLDICCLNETNLSPDIVSETLNLPQNFDFLRRDRQNGSNRGGCAILVNKFIKYKDMDLLQDLGINMSEADLSKIEAKWIHLTDFNIYVCAFYRSEQLCSLEIFLSYYVMCMLKLSDSHSTKKVIWIGDINIDQRKITSFDYKKLDLHLRLFGLIQSIKDITRRAYLGDLLTESTIDVIFTNCYSDFKYAKVLSKQIGDHQSIKCELNFNVTKADKFKKITIRDHCNKNMTALLDYLSNGSDYSGIIQSQDVNAATEGLTHHINNAYDTFCPQKTIKIHSHYLYKPSKEVLNAISKKGKLFSKYQKLAKTNKESARCKSAWENYKVERNRVTKLSREHREKIVVDDLLKNSACNDLKAVWKTIKHASNLPTKSKDDCPPLDPNVANEFFCKVGDNIHKSIKSFYPDSEVDKYLPPKIHTEILSSFDSVSESEITDFIKGIPSDKSSNDYIPFKIIKSIVPAIIKPLTHIINLSLKTGIMPNAGKTATVKLIFKAPGNKYDPGDYRPISLLSVIAKCIEYFVNKQLTDYIKRNNILTEHQFGFRSGNSTTFLMVQFFEKIYTSKDKNKKPAALFLDIRKAFDTVSHRLLLRKLKHYGIAGSVLQWFSNYLSGRSQCTKIGFSISEKGIILTGVPQGSILGPILFSIFINDIVNAITDSVPFLFADDGALVFDNVDRRSYSNIKAEIENISKWLEINKLSLRFDKTHFMVFDSSPDKGEFSIIINNEIVKITEEKSKKYLGLMVDSKLNFHDHIDYIKKKVAKRVGAMYRSKSLLPLKYRKMFANALVLPYFDYLCIIWGRTDQSKLTELDIIYKKVAKIALDYKPRTESIKVYSDMGWLPLNLRRQLHLTNYVFRIIHGKAPKQFSNMFSYISGGSRDGDKCNLYIRKSKSHKKLSYLGPKCWNILHPDCREMDDLEKFSKHLKLCFLHAISSDPLFSVNYKFDTFYTPPAFKI